MKTVRLKDIADKTGFSISTISRILSGDTNRKMKEETISLVLKTADEMGYYKAKNQKLRQALPAIRLVAIYNEEQNRLSPLALGILDGIRKEVIEEQRHMRLEYEALSVTDTNFRTRIEKTRIDAAILVGRFDDDTIRYLRSRIRYIMYTGLDSLEGFDEVISDAREGIRKGVTFLSDRGRRSIAYVGPVEKRYGYTYLGYLEGLADSHLGHDSNLVENVKEATVDGFEGALRLLSRTKPDAIVAANDNIAIGVLRALKEKGIECPKEVALLGFDNQESSAYLEPSLSTFEVPKKDLGRFSVKIAIDRIENPREGNIRITLPYTFIERESTGKLL